MRNMIVVAGLVAGLAAGSAQAEWVDVSYTATLPNEAVYCEGQKNLRSFIGYVQDQDERGAMRMISTGDCRMTNGPLKISVFQEEKDDELITFLTPSGKAFYTLKGYVK
ncbi:hypothetical protein L1F06_017005 [Ectopseudomonas hydrolytica]|uniref:Uncharacterized protein n=1 Tax=Ectopseudomonas hydrolytica TaxID=2493633 RepID=A0ABY5A5P4_9GAMM|nr:hypothetical protein [Pseudomonas hydrolytica]USR38359.1 hypothetical protein L1F06_017005 [Pseudomonas hydrolytica]